MNMSNGHFWKHSSFIENNNYSFSKEEILKNITKEQIDEAYLTAMKSGALGGKICGAGGGGFLMFLADPQFHSNIISNLRKFNFERYSLDFFDYGSQVFEID